MNFKHLETSKYFNIFSKALFDKTHTAKSLREKMYDDGSLFYQNLESAINKSDFVSKYKLLRNDSLNGNKDPDLVNFKKLIGKQLGNPLHINESIPSDMSIHTSVSVSLSKDELRLFALFALKIQIGTVCGSARIDYTKRSKKLSNDLFLAYANNDFHRVDEDIERIMESYANSLAVRNIGNNHYYINTFFAGLFKECKESVIFPSSEFLWIKSSNRELWYLLNNVGRKVVWIECFCSWHHFLDEIKNKSALVDPKFNTITKDLCDYLNIKIGAKT